MRPNLFAQICCLLILATPGLQGAGTEIAGERAPATTICPTPEEARAKMSVPEGYEVRCFAHEPMVQNPVAMTWDHRGRMWVVEAYEYPEGSPHPAPFGGVATDDRYHPMPAYGDKIPRDRVIILEDTDNNGEADKRTVFLEGLNLASGIICGDDGIYIGQQPHLLHFRDNDGDDKPDEWRVVLTGFGREDTHELVNSFNWGPDGWLYMTHGVFTNSKVRRPGQPENEGFKFDAGIGRARPTTHEREAAWEFEVFADGTSNPWGCDYDAAGNFFVSACVIDHFFHLAPGGIYVRQGGAPENPYSYELLPSIVKHKHFRAAYAGIQIYQGGRYPADTHGHAFIGNIHDNAIHEEVLTPVGATFKCEPRRDFLRANDGWFRPVSTQTGPDGFLWIMDWCDKYPCYQNAKANPEGVDRDRGRIWRVVWKDGQPMGSRPEEEFRMFDGTTSRAVNALSNSNSWIRRMARRNIVDLLSNPEIHNGLPTEGETHAFHDLEKLAVETNSTNTQLEALWTLASINGKWFQISDEILDRLANDPKPALRAWVARLTGERDATLIRSLAIESGSITDPKGNSSHFEHSNNLLAKLSLDSDPSVKLAVHIALRQHTSGWLTVDRVPLSEEQTHVINRTSPMTVMSSIVADENVTGIDTYLSFSAWQALEPMLVASPFHVLREIAMSKDCAAIRTLSHKAMRRLCDTRKAENLDLALDFCDKIGAQDTLLAHALDGLVKGQEGGVIKPLKDASSHLAKWRASGNADVRKQAQTLAVLWGDEAAVKEMIVTLHDSAKPEKERVAALLSLRKVKTDTVKQGLKPVLAAGTSTTLAVAAIRAAADLGGDDFIPPLLQQAASKDFNIRTTALEALASRETWTKAMLEAVKAGQVSATGFPAPVRRSLATHKDKTIRDLAFKVLGAWQDSSEDMKSLIAQKKQACLTGEPDLANGKLMFTATCMVCHEFHGGGQKVGPDLIGSGRSNLDAILANVIDPNQIIGNGYENFTVSTKDGRTLSGRVVEDTPSHVKLLGAGGATQVVPREQVATMTNTKQSLMPMGFGNLPDAAFRDLIWYVLAPPEEGPLTKEKKDLLVKGVEVGDPAKPKGTNWRAIDWESVSLWNPDWKVSAPDFERTPVKLAEYHGQKNVLLMHPFPDKKTPASLEQTFKVSPGKTKLKVTAAADDRGDWTFKTTVNGQIVKESTVDHEKPRWKEFEIDLSRFSGKDVTVRLEAHANGWNMEFSYWGGVKFE